MLFLITVSDKLRQTPKLRTDTMFMKRFWFYLCVSGAVLLRPTLWPVTVKQLIRFAPDRWWRRAPFLPLPTSSIMSFRSEAMYGNADCTPKSHDVIVWLEWCRKF